MKVYFTDSEVLSGNEKPDFEEILIFTNRSHRDGNVQAQNRLVVLINHLASNGILAWWGALVEDRLLLNLDSTSRSRASQSIDINTSSSERQVNNTIAAKITRLMEHGQTHIRSSHTPLSTGNSLVQSAKTNYSGVLTRNNRVVDDRHLGHLSMVVRIVANFPGNQVRLSNNDLQ